MPDTIPNPSQVTPLRTEYRDGAVVTAAALEGDAAANMAAWQQHQSRMHSGGIVGGLLVSLDVQDVTQQRVIVSSGAAIDANGRLLLVGNPLQRRVDQQPARDEYLLVTLKDNSTQVPSQDTEQDRYLETPAIGLSIVKQAACAVGLGSSSEIILGLLTAADGKLAIQPCRRTYIGAVGSRVDSPSGRARIVLGPQFPRDNRRFAIGVQSDSQQPISDVLTWESTGTIRFSNPTSVALPAQSATNREAVRPPIAVVGSPSVNVAPEDVLDPCLAWERLRIGNAETRNRRGNQPEFPTFVLELLPECERAEFVVRPACRTRLTTLLLCVLNGLIRKMSDDFLDTAQGTESRVRRLERFSHLLQTAFPRERLATLIPHWYCLPGGLICRLLLDKLLHGALRPLPAPPSRGLFFNGSSVADPESSPSRIHLAEFQQDGQTYRQLRITIPDPGKDNHPHRYRCSIGIANCNDPAVPLPASAPGAEIWNRQTSYPRGILSVLADKSIDIHRSLNVYAREGDIDAGSVLKLDPAGGAAAGQSGAVPVPSTPVLGNAVAWEGPRVRRTQPGRLEIGGALRNLTNLPIESLQVLISIFGKNDTSHDPIHQSLVSGGILGPGPNSVLPINSLTLDSDPRVALTGGAIIVSFTGPFTAAPIIVNLLVMGVTQFNAIISTQYREDL